MKEMSVKFLVDFLVLSKTHKLGIPFTFMKNLLHLIRDKLPNKVTGNEVAKIIKVILSDTAWWFFYSPVSKNWVITDISTLQSWEPDSCGIEILSSWENVLEAMSSGTRILETTTKKK